MRTIIKTTGIIVLLIVVTTVALSAHAWRWLHTPTAEVAATNFEVIRGESVSSIAHHLQQTGWIQHPRIWALWARYQQLGGKIKAGEYALTPGLTPQQLLQMLTSGNVILRSLTIVEGSTYAELRRLIAQRDDIKHTLNSVSDAELMQILGAPDQHPEAQFFPDTYQFAKGISDIDILRIAQQRMQHELTAAWAARAPDLSLHSPYEALILASIIE